ncbi:MAG: bifunctional glutamine-synthetase adenylyltransferase/deadenyltransferase, partial [Micrococcus sp.]|nr:bifunctional glutamine-synthetase adenylyltransferase/deadenyltransferase [Micrococcus sp.]
MSSLPENTAEVSRRAMSAAGFANPTRAKSLLASRELEGLDLEALVTALAHAADSDHAVLLWVRLIERADQARTLLADPEAALTLTRLLGASEALGEFLIRRPENLDLIAAPHRAEATAPALGLIGTDADWPDSADTLRRLLLEAVDADPEAPAPHTRLDPDEAVIALRRAYRRQLTAIALADLAAADAADVQPSVAAWLADLAGAALHAGLAVSRTRVRERLGAAVDHVRLAVIGMGKCGAR